jgi:hypothetical protein
VNSRPFQPRVPDIGHLPLDAGLVLRFAGPRRVDQDAVVRGELGIGLVQLRVVEVGLFHASLQIVRDQPGRAAAEERERLDMTGLPGCVVNPGVDGFR